VVPSERPAPANLPQALGRLRVALDDGFLRASRTVGLTPQQAELLCAAMAPSAVKELAVTLRCDRSNVTRLVDRAAAHGYLRRRGEEEDGRVTVVELTPEGQRLANRFLEALEAQTEVLRQSWPANRAAVAVEVLNEISESLDATRERPRQRRKRSSRVSAAEASE
jgi:DNA-binding MarR family transcriptional regulator